MNKINVLIFFVIVLTRCGAFTPNGPLPTVPSSPLDGLTTVSEGTNIVMNFTNSMDPTTITTNNENFDLSTSCTGSIQLSTTASNFSSCLRLGTPVASNLNRTFTMTPVHYLTGETEYTIKITNTAVNTGGITIDLTTFNFTTTDSGVSEIALRNDHVCAIIDNGSVSCWGANVDGQMGIGSFSTRELIPVTAQLPAGRTATKIATGAFLVVP